MGEAHFLVGWNGDRHQWAITRCGRRGMISGGWSDGFAEFDDSASNRFVATHEQRHVTCRRCTSPKIAGGHDHG